MKRQEYRDRVIKTLNFEQQIFKEFEQLCQEENVYPSQKLQELMIETLQKKVVGQNPLNISYGKVQDKPLQSDLRQWIPRNEALTMAKRLPISHQEWQHLGDTFHIIALKKRTGYL